MADFEPLKPVSAAWPVREPKKTGPRRKRRGPGEQRRRDQREDRGRDGDDRRIDEFA